MSSVASFVRNTPITSLQTYFDKSGIDLRPAVNWNAPESEVVRPLLRAIEELDDVSRERVVHEADRVTAMADEPGQTALDNVVQDHERLETLKNPLDRALWTFLNDPVGFQHAEEVRFTDEHRHGRMWDGFIGTAGLALHQKAGHLASFKQAIRKRFRSDNVHVDIFDRHRPTFDGDDCELVQVTLYREGLPDDFLEFKDGVLGHRPRRPVYEAALTYEPATGFIEVVSNGRDDREDLVRLLAHHLLDAEFRQERLPLRRHDLAVLLRPFDFPNDSEDGIESVRVNRLRLMPIDCVGERVTLECMRAASRTIWEMAQERFGGTNPLLGGWVITQAKLTIRFYPEAGYRRRRTLPLTITMPHGCDLKDRTERERMIGEKYLRRWGIVRHV